MATVSEIFYFTDICYILYENCDIATAMSSSRADHVLGLYILSYCPGWGNLNI